MAFVTKECKCIRNAPLAQLDRAFGYGPKGRGFESSNARTKKTPAETQVFFHAPVWHFFLNSTFLPDTGRNPMQPAFAFLTESAVSR